VRLFIYSILINFEITLAMKMANLFFGVVLSIGQCPQLLMFVLDSLLGINYGLKKRLT